MYNHRQTRWQDRGRNLGSCVRAFIGRYLYRGLIRGVPSDAETVATGTCPVRLAQSMARRGFQYSRTLLKRSRRRYLRPRPSRTTLGHANISVTLDRYSHCVPSLGAGTAAAMDEIFA